MDLKPAGDEAPNSGHHHVLVDLDAMPKGTAVPFDAMHLHFGKVQTEAEIKLPPVHLPAHDATRGQGPQVLRPADALTDQYYCSGCHVVDKTVVGPAFRDAAKKYAGDANAPKALAMRMRQGGQGNWGATPMPANVEIPDPALAALIAWFLALR